MRTRPFALIVATLVLSTGCSRLFGRTLRGDGVEKTETRALSGPVTAIDQRAFANVEVKAAGATSVSVTCDENLLPHLVTRLDGARLVVEQTPTNLTLRPTRSCVVAVTTPSLERLDQSGAGRTSVAGPLKTPAFALDFSGAGTVDVAGLDVGTVTVKASGAGEISLAGRAKTASLDLSGTGRLDAAHLAVEDATVGLSGAGSVALDATKSFHGHLSGVGSVTVAGKPAVRDAQVSGVARVTYE